MSTASTLDHQDHSSQGHTSSGGLGHFIGTYVFARDHKVIGLQFLFSVLIWFLIGGFLALAVRWQVAWPWGEGAPFDMSMPIIGDLFFAEQGGQISPEFYTMLFTMHATVMIFFVIIPVLAGAFGNFLIPLMIGADDMAFPTLNMLSYWFMWPAFIAMTASFFMEGGGPASGWTSYPPLSVLTEASPGSGAAQNLWLVGVVFIGISSMTGSINYLTTIFQMRGTGHDDVSAAADDLGNHYHSDLASVCPAGSDCCRSHAGHRPGNRYRLLPSRRCDGKQHGRRRRWWAATFVAASLLVLFTSGRLHHASACNGDGIRYY